MSKERTICALAWSLFGTMNGVAGSLWGDGEIGAAILAIVIGIPGFVIGSIAWHWGH